MVGPSGPFWPTMGVMLDSIRYRLYAIESETSEPSGTMARIILEDAEGRILVVVATPGVFGVVVLVF